MRIRGVALVIAASLALVACATPDDPEASPSPPPATVEPSPTPTAEPSAEPTPEPEPTRPPLAELVVSPEGLGPLGIGDTVEEDTIAGLVVFDADFCGPEVLQPGEEPGRWTAHPDYAADTVYGGSLAFGPGVGEGEILTRIDIFAPLLRTAEGIGIGSTEDDLLVAYPEATATEFFATRLYVVPGNRGDLHLEVAMAEDGGFSGWAPEEVGTVRFLRVVLAGQSPYTVAFSDNVVPGCL